MTSVFWFFGVPYSRKTTSFMDSVYFSHSLSVTLLTIAAIKLIVKILPSQQMLTWCELNELVI
jgi:hypothetical protein